MPNNDTVDVEGPPEGGISPGPGDVTATLEGAAPGTVPLGSPTATLEGGPPTAAEGMPQPSGRGGFMEIPGWLGGPQGPLGQIMGGVAGMGGQAQPPGAQVAQRHGGFLTGLAGVLIEGLASGMAPTAQMAYQIPMQINQQRMQQQELQQNQMKLQQEMAEAPARQAATIAQARINMFRAEEMSRELTWEVKSGLTQARAKAVEDAIVRGDATDIGTAATVEEAQQHVTQETQANKTPNRQIDYYPGPLNPDGNPKNYHIYEWYPANTLKEDVDFDLPEIPGMAASEGQPAIPAVPAVHRTFHAGTSMLAYDSETKRLGAEHTAAGASLREGIEARRETRAEQVDVRKLDEPHVVFMKNGDKRIMEEGQAMEAERSGQASFHTKADMKSVQSAQLGMNDLQNSVNQLAEVNYQKVQPGLAAALIAQDDSVDATAKTAMIGVHLPTERAYANLRAVNTANANQDTRNYVTSLELAYEGMTQLPRLQTLAGVNRMSQQQMDAARATLPRPGEEAMARQKLSQMQQQLIDPVRRGIPHGPGLELDKAWNDQGYQPRGFKILPAPGVRTTEGGTADETTPRSAGGRSPDQLQKEGWMWKKGSQGLGWYK